MKNLTRRKFNTKLTKGVGGLALLSSIPLACGMGKRIPLNLGNMGIVTI